MQTLYFTLLTQSMCTQLLGFFLHLLIFFSSGSYHLRSFLLLFSSSLSNKLIDSCFFPSNDAKERKREREKQRTTTTIAREKHTYTGIGDTHSLTHTGRERQESTTMINIGPVCSIADEHDVESVLHVMV